MTIRGTFTEIKKVGRGTIYLATHNKEGREMLELKEKSKITGTTHQVTWRLKSCPRRRGDLFLERDVKKEIESCLQCGFVH